MKLFSTQQAAMIIAERTGKPISQRQIQHEIKKGYLNAERLGEKNYAITEESLNAYVRRKPGHQKTK